MVWVGSKKYFPLIQGLLVILLYHQHFEVIHSWISLGVKSHQQMSQRDWLKISILQMRGLASL